MKSPSASSLNDRAHDITLILIIPLVIYAVAHLGLSAFFYDAFREKGTYSPEPARGVALWHIALISIILTSCIAGRVTALIHAKEKHWKLNPPPLFIIRKWGIVFCWSEHMTYICKMSIRWLHLDKIQMPHIKMPHFGLPNSTGWMRRKRRRFRIRLLWRTRRIRAIIDLNRIRVVKFSRTQLTMAKLNISIEHKLDKAVAFARIRQLLTKVKEQHSNKISDLREDWNEAGCVGSFSFKAPGFSKISGVLTVTAKSVILNGEISGFAAMKSGDIKTIILQEGTKILQEPAHVAAPVPIAAPAPISVVDTPARVERAEVTPTPVTVRPTSAPVTVRPVRITAKPKAPVVPTPKTFVPTRTRVEAVPARLFEREIAEFSDSIINGIRAHLDTIRI